MTREPRRRGAPPVLRCPTCERPALAPTRLAAGLPAAACPTCEGHWVAAEDYRAWLRRRRAAGDIERPDGAPVVVADVQHARLCPSCRRIMLRHQVGHGVDVAIDICGWCGVWFDRNEWRALAGRNLHDDLHLVATEPWQAEVRREEARARLEALYRTRYGADYDEVLRVHRWLAAHPLRDSILAFLRDPDPFVV